MAFAILGNPHPQFFDSSGAPLTGGTLTIVEPSTDVNKATYPDYDNAEAATNPNDNPITLDARGECDLWGLDGEDYKITVKDSNGATVWTTDDVFLPAKAEGQTTDEIAASVTPTNLEYPPGDLRRYGATLDGVVDDGSAVTDWVNVGLQGTPLYHPGGTALCTTWTEIVAATDLYITAEAQGSLKGDGTVNFVQPAGGDIVIKGVVFDTWLGVFQNSSGDTGTTDLLDIRGCQFLTIGTGLCVDHERPLNKAFIDGNYFNATTGHTVRIGWNDYASQDNWQRISITNNKAVDIDATGSSAAAFCIVYGKWVNIEGNHIEDVDTDTGEARPIYTKCRYTTIKNNKINDVATSSGSVWAINVKGSNRGVVTAPQGFATIVEGNILLGTGSGTGIRVQCDDSKVVDNTVENFVVGIEASGADDERNTIISKNHIICKDVVALTYGINLLAESSHLACTNNIIEDGNIGIRLAASAAAANWTIDNNIIRGGAATGISCSNGVYITDISISNNTISDTTSNGLFLGELQRVKIFDNIIEEASGNVMDFQGTDSLKDVSLRHRFEKQTTDGTVATLVGFTLEDNTAASVKMNVTAMESDGSDRALYGIQGLFYRDGGSATQEGSTIDLFTAIESDATWAGATLTVSGNDVLCRIDGVAAQTINWAALVEIESVA